ncbi:MAG TPA: dTDP-4-dehydrorhamnose reductase [Bacillota bacterium]|nr:dTDP-4-dehydrorhamnose reductase [Bacillota bacterium]
MRILVTGAKGQLGFDTLKELSRRKYTDILGIDYEDLDLVDEEKTRKFVLDFKPDVIMHNAAYTAVDKAEDEKEKCYDINVNGTKNLINPAKEIGAKFLFISTDYVFGGKSDEPYEIDSPKNPLSTYGSSKSLAEDLVQAYNKHFVVRTSWVYGSNGHNFVKTMLRLGKEKKELSIVSDQIGSPTYTVDLAKLLCDMIGTDSYGIYHATNEGYCSWYEFAKKIFSLTGNQILVNPVTSEQYPTKAIRPMNSRLSKKSLTENGFSLLPVWDNALERYLKEIGEII